MGNYQQHKHPKGMDVNVNSDAIYMYETQSNLMVAFPLG